MSSDVSYLLDSHVLLWWWFDPDRLSEPVRDAIQDPANPVLVSAATVWELSLKHQQGKLPELDEAMADLPGLLQADGFGALPISLFHGLRAGGYSHAHRDPFDRMLAAQAELERLVLITADPQLSSFSCQIFW
jgi:PIN domain nuclease of toxin-antitoxin system